MLKRERERKAPREGECLFPYKPQLVTFIFFFFSGHQGLLYIIEALKHVLNLLVALFSLFVDIPLDLQTNSIIKSYSTSFLGIYRAKKMARVGGLEVYAMKNGEPELLPSNSERYLIVEGIVHLALSLIENPAGRNSLVQVATTIVNHRNNPPGKKRKPVPHAYKYSLGEMPHWIDKFVQGLRSNFPQVSIYHMDSRSDAAAIKQDWEHNMTDWNPKSAAYMYVSDMIIHNMAHIRRQPPNIARDNYNKFKFQMVIAVVHEITHILTGYITGQAEPLTPPTVTLELYGDTRKGEAGRHWEGMLLGGVVEFY